MVKTTINNKNQLKPLIKCLCLERESEYHHFFRSLFSGREQFVIYHKEILRANGKKTTENCYHKNQKLIGIFCLYHANYYIFFWFACNIHDYIWSNAIINWMEYIWRLFSKVHIVVTQTIDNFFSHVNCNWKNSRLIYKQK